MPAAHIWHSLESKAYHRVGGMTKFQLPAGLTCGNTAYYGFETRKTLQSDVPGAWLAPVTPPGQMTDRQRLAALARESRRLHGDGLTLAERNVA